MVLLILGRTKCAVCKKTIKKHDQFVGFPHFVLNEADPLYRFSDAACHEACFRADPSGPPMVDALEQRDARTGPGKRTCAVCGENVKDYDDYFHIGYLGDPDAVPLGKFNYTHFHNFHISGWEHATEFLMLAKVAIDEKRWRGPMLEDMMREIEARIQRERASGS